MFENYFDTVAISATEWGKHEKINSSPFRDNLNNVQ